MIVFMILAFIHFNSTVITNLYEGTHASNQFESTNVLQRLGLIEGLRSIVGQPQIKLEIA